MVRILMATINRFLPSKMLFFFCCWFFEHKIESHFRQTFHFASFITAQNPQNLLFIYQNKLNEMNFLILYYV